MSLLSITNQTVSPLTDKHGVVEYEQTPLFDVAMQLDRGKLQALIKVREWLMSEEAQKNEFDYIINNFANSVVELGIPLDRMTVAVEQLHAQYAGVGRYWEREAVEQRIEYFPHQGRIENLYLSSPIYHVHQTRTWLHLDLRYTQDNLFGIVPELKAGRYTHYICVPLFFTNGSGNAVTFASRSEEGFTQEHVNALRFLMPTFSLIAELRATNRQLNDVLRIYVGDEPHREILSGVIRRGQVSRIRSAILFADMRSYTRLSSRMNPEETVALLNDFFDYLVPPIEEEGGEVLKYMGDGLLAIFRDRGDDTGAAAYSALTAAKSAFARVDEARSVGSSLYPVDFGIALHHGEAAYGNVGSGLRLDFTVIGRDVNIASRVARLNKTLNRPLLMTKAFTNHLWQDVKELGYHMIEGLDEEIALYC